MKIHHILLIMWVLLMLFMLVNWFNKPYKKK
ncbi:MAG: hypothetical protein RLZ89_507 [Pseudomonadota bacterium]|jgi:hypothetical protein